MNKFRHQEVIDSLALDITRSSNFEEEKKKHTRVGARSTTTMVKRIVLRPPVDFGPPDAVWYQQSRPGDDALRLVYRVDDIYYDLQGQALPEASHLLRLSPEILGDPSSLVMESLEFEKLFEDRMPPPLLPPERHTAADVIIQAEPVPARSVEAVHAVPQQQQQSVGDWLKGQGRKLQDWAEKYRDVSCCANEEMLAETTTTVPPVQAVTGVQDVDDEKRV